MWFLWLLTSGMSEFTGIKFKVLSASCYLLKKRSNPSILQLEKASLKLCTSRMLFCPFQAAAWPLQLAQTQMWSVSLHSKNGAACGGLVGVAFSRREGGFHLSVCWIVFQCWPTFASNWILSVASFLSSIFIWVTARERQGQTQFLLSYWDFSQNPLGPLRGHRVRRRMRENRAWTAFICANFC